MKTPRSPSQGADQRPRVLSVINSLRVGGAERCLVDLQLALDPARYRRQVVCLYRGGELVASLERAGVPVIVLGISKRFFPWNWLTVWYAIRKSRPAIVHAHLPEACWYAMPAAWAAGVRVRIAHVHSCYRQWGTRARMMDRVMARFMTLAVACSNAVRDFVVSQIHYPRSKVQVVLNGVDVPRFARAIPRAAARASAGLPPYAQVLCCVASLTPAKGHEYLLRAFASLTQEWPDLVLLLVGDGSLDGALRQQCQDLGIAGRVRFLGSRSDVPTIMAASEIVVLASLREGFPLVLGEAAAAGLPVVATAIDGIPEVVIDGQTGLLVPSRSAEDLARAIGKLLSDPELRLAMSVRARGRAAEILTTARFAAEIENVYERLLLADDRKRV